ncbi:MAG TPA: glycoside hydrolase family 140 protein [Bacteroidales bacterium]|nr:glycoside hydrolase family 140 protein [Bacteroidales bacterium]
MKIRHIILIIILLNCALSQAEENSWKGPSVDFRHGKLKVSGNRRFLVFEDGTPFFYLGDTGWELFHRLTRDETETYLENRRSKGFTVIQAVILAEFDGLEIPDAEGNKPLVGDDPLKPDEKYFSRVDWVIRKAGEKGLFIGLLPTWGDKVDVQWGKGPKIFSAENGFKYGQWLGTRYRDYPNIIWINGGDRNGGGDNSAVWNAIAEGIKSADHNHLMTFHPWGEHSSSEWFQQCGWLDFNMTQTGHSQRSYAIFKQLIVHDYNLTPVKPCMDGEPRYEDHPVAWTPDVFGWFNDADVRQALYWDLFSGACGHTYGCHPIWQFLSPSREPIGLARHNWTDAINFPGAGQLIHARRLMESRPYLSRVPDQSLIASSYYPETDYVVATRGDGYAFVYFPTGWQAEIALDRIGAKEITAWWYDPRTGKALPAGNYSGNDRIKFLPPSGGRGNDWILVLDDSSRKFSTPGAQAINIL